MTADRPYDPTQEDRPYDAADFPGVLGEIAAVIGPAMAARVAEHLGGQYVWLAARPTPSNPLLRVIGRTRAEAVAAALGPNQKLVIPCGGFRGAPGRRRRIAALLTKGWPHNAIAQEIGCHVRTVERVAAETAPGADDTAQPSLFD